MVEASASEEAAGRDGEYRLLIWPSFVRRRVIITALALVVLACAAVQGSAAAVGRKQIHNLWEEGETVEVYIYTSEQNEPFYGRGALFNETRPVYRNTTTFGESLSLKSVQPVNVSVPRDVRRNQTSLFAHVFICRRGSDPNPFSEAARADRERSRNVIYRGVDLTRILPEIKKPHLRFLLRDPPPPPPAPSLQAGGKRILPYWAPRLALFVVTDFSTYAEMNEEHVSPYMLYFFTQGSDSYDLRTRTYVPVLHVDDLGTLQKDLLMLNETTVTMPLSISIEPVGKSRFEWMLKMEQSVQMHRELGTPESEMEEVRRMFVETSSWLLIVTIVVSFVHLLFDMLAFKNDIQFWSGLKSTKGISVQSISVSTVMEVVVFFYLVDTETSYLVLFTVAGTIVVNSWKLLRAWRMMGGAGPARAGDKSAPPTPEESKEIEASVEAQRVSQQIDRLAARYLFHCLAPPILGYAVFSLVYEQHKGWYSWLLKSGVNCVYAVGFMMMTPQLFLNYKYKSVEHLPWRALVYRALNTFIDDLFAFVIHMPGMHRMSVFRDDIVFVIYIYQRFIYSKRRPAADWPAEDKPAKEAATAPAEGKKAN